MFNCTLLKKYTVVPSTVVGSPQLSTCGNQVDGNGRQAEHHALDRISQYVAMYRETTSAVAAKAVKSDFLPILIKKCIKKSDALPPTVLAVSG